MLYNLKAGIGCVEPSLLVNEIAPTLKQVKGESVASTLALPLLWAALESSDVSCNILPSQLKQRIVQAYTNAGGNRAVNPVDREALYVLGDGSQLNLVVITNNETGEENCNRAYWSGGGGEATRREFAALHSQLLASRRYMTEVMNEVLRSRCEIQREMQKTQAILKRLAAYPVPRHTRSGHNTTDQVQTDDDTNTTRHRVSPARLSKRPKDLFELWHEYQFGLAGLKPAKQFASAERGANKFAYSRRKHFWDVVVSLIRSGYTSDSAIDRIYAVYGRQLSVSSILIGLRADKRRGGHLGLEYSNIHNIDQSIS